MSFSLSLIELHRLVRAVRTLETLWGSYPGSEVCTRAALKHVILGSRLTRTQAIQLINMILS